MAKIVYLQHENEERAKNRNEQEPHMFSHLICGNYLTFTTLLGRKGEDCIHAIYAHYGETQATLNSSKLF